ncbi:MAG: hypothetical protein K1000chlam4_00634 [Chlamydiae bacterium]|nr:hypothetical protein [Chlamydiota bacterium]
MGKKIGQRIHLLRELVNDGHRIFTMSQAWGKAKQLNINEKYIAEALCHLKRDNWIRTLKRGVYALTAESGFGSPPHNFEIAMALVSPSAISHWTALYQPLFARTLLLRKYLPAKERD